MRRGVHTRSNETRLTSSQGGQGAYFLVQCYFFGEHLSASMHSVPKLSRSRLRFVFFAS